jgi:hypothetical protein
MMGINYVLLLRKESELSTGNNEARCMKFEGSVPNKERSNSSPLFYSFCFTKIGAAKKGQFLSRGLWEGGMLLKAALIQNLLRVWS